MNKDMEVILSACEKPIILAPDDVSVGNIFTICDNQGSRFPFVISSVKVAPSNSSITENLTDDNALQTARAKPPVVNSQRPNASDTIARCDSKLSCKVCGKQFTRQENLTFHEQTHNSSDLLHCNTCNKSFFTSKSLIGHLASHRKKKSDAPEEAFEECEVCGRYFHKSCIAEHEKGYKNQLLFHCRFCEQTFSKKGLLIYHLKLHSVEEGKSEKQKAHECDICSKTTSPSENAKILSVDKKRPSPDLNHTPEIPPVLEKQTLRSKRIKRGRLPNRSNKMPVLKPEVHAKAQKSVTKNHPRSNGTEDTIIISDDENDVNEQKGLTFQSYSSCEICLKTFPHNKLLLDHSTEHLELQCVDCGQYFSGIHEMLQHEEFLHTIQCYTCKKCDRTITLKSNFIEHILTHDSNSLQVCKVCYLYLFQKYTKYLARFQLFTGRKAFQCDICCKILQTVNIESLSCYLCPEQFPSESLLKEHCEANCSSNVKCFECNQYFHSVADFNAHSASAKNDCIVSHRRHLFTNKSDFNCLKCFVEFLTPEKLLEHCLQMQHYKCGNCDVTFSDWENYNSHLVLYPVVLCTGCQLFVLGAMSLEKHKYLCLQISRASMQSATNFDHTRNLLCIECNATFSKKECLIEHIIFLH